MNTPKGGAHRFEKQGKLPVCLAEMALFVMSLCSDCASIGVTCCCKKERDILVTPGDIARIRHALGSDDFWEYREPGDPAYLDQDEDPNWLLYTVRADGTRKVLKKTDPETCVFLTDSGCRLDVETRPLVCRMYPFVYTEHGITGIDAEECPTRLLPSGETLLRALDMSYEDGRRWRDMLYYELRAEGEHLS